MTVRQAPCQIPPVSLIGADFPWLGKAPGHHHRVEAEKRSLQAVFRSVRFLIGMTLVLDQAGTRARSNHGTRFVVRTIP